MLPLKLSILVGLILAHAFIFPPYFFPVIEDDGIRCGMPLLGVTLAFWIFGIPATILTHVTYLLIKIPKRPGASVK
jgi:hypothetical protein